MERKLLILFVLLSVFLFGSLVIKKFKQVEPSSVEAPQGSNDSVAKYQVFSSYLGNILATNYKWGQIKLNNLKFYKVAKSGEKSLVELPKKDKFVIRYNEIGCNTCVNLIFKDKESLDAIKKKYDFIVIVDFERYEDFVRWKRTSEMENNIFWVKKDTLPFDEHFNNNSYTFILNSDNEVHSIFMPDSQFPEQLKKYLKAITSN